MSTRTRSAEDDLRREAEAGFTLIEMVISIVLLTFILGAISAAFVSSMNATSASKHRVNASNDAQLISGFLTRDAQAAGGTDPTTGYKDPTLGVTAGAENGCTTPVPPILSLKWIDLATGTTFVSSYSYVDTATGAYQPQQLLRTICTTPPSAPTDTATSVLANNVVTTATATLSTPVAWCDNNRPPAAPACTTRFPNTVSMGVSVNNAGQNLTPPFSFILTASLRPQSNAHPDLGSSATTASLVLLGAGGDCPNSGVASIDAQSASFSITIYGAAALSGCATNLKKDANPFGPVYVSAPGTCADFPVSPPCVVVNNRFTDPFVARIASGALTAPPVNCASAPPAVGGNGHWQPGTYPQDPQSGGVTRTFDPGVYVFCNGLSGDVTANLQGGPIGGTLFYFSGGAYNVCPVFSPSCSSTVQLTPPTSGQYAGLAVWQAATDNTTITMSKGLVNITGTVYAPSALVSLKNGSININQLIAFAIDGNPGNPNVHIGPPLRVTVPNPLPPGAQNQTYSGAQATAVDGTGVYSGWTISGVAGLTISSTGLIGGTPSASVTPGVYTVTVGVNDNDGEHATATAQVTIYPALTIGGTLPNWSVNKPGYPANPLTAAGGSGTGYTWTASNMPIGLQLDATGTISGSPTAVGTYHPTITLTDSIGDSTTINPTVTINAPLTITSVQFLNGGTAGRADKGDQVVITFSARMAVSSICSAWAGDASNQGPISGNGDVKVTVNNGSGTANDTLTVQSSTCTTLNFGTIDLGSASWVASSVTFSGNGSNASKLAWNATSFKLTVTLGSGGSIVVPSPISPVYNASSSVTDTAGGTVSNSPFSPLTGAF